MVVGKKRAPGFTLVELLIVVAVIGILASIGGVQYHSYRVKCHNAAAIESLRNFKAAMELYYANNSSYP